MGVCWGLGGRVALMWCPLPFPLCQFLALFVKIRRSEVPKTMTVKAAILCTAVLHHAVTS